MSTNPPYTITDKMVSHVAQIASLLPTIAPQVNMRLRKDRNIRSIHSSLAIENNSLSLAQVTDVVNGRRIVGAPSEIREVKNAFAAYSHIENFSPFCSGDFLKAHKQMMNGLVEDAGNFRSRGVGIYDGKKLVHTAPPAKLVPAHMENLFTWAQNSEVHPLIKSSVVHYEIEFIHPFMDGNGRMGRLWQTVILSQWDPLFLSLPTETVIFERQRDYYAALGQSDKAGHSSAFIEFMLAAIADALARQDTHPAAAQVTAQVAAQVVRFCAAPRSAKEIMAMLGLKHWKTFQTNYLNPLLAQCLIERTLPNKPTSRFQKYKTVTMSSTLGACQLPPPVKLRGGSIAFEKIDRAKKAERR